MLVTLSECLLNIVRNTVDIGVSTPSPLQKHCHLFLAKLPFESTNLSSPSFLKIWLEAQSPLQKGRVPTMKQLMFNDDMFHRIGGVTPSLLEQVLKSTNNSTINNFINNSMKRCLKNSTLNPI